MNNEATTTASFLYKAFVERYEDTLYKVVGGGSTNPSQKKRTELRKKRKKKKR